VKRTRERVHRSREGVKAWRGASGLPPAFPGCYALLGVADIPRRETRVAQGSAPLMGRMGHGGARWQDI